MPEVIPTLQGLLVILVAVVPGYIGVTFWARTKTWERPPSDLTLILLAVIVSAVIQAVLFPITIVLLWPVRDHLVDHPWSLWWWAVALIVIPAIGGTYAGRISDLIFGVRGWPRSRPEWQEEFFPPLNELLPNVPPTAWDQFFLRAVPRGKLLVVTLDGGKVIAGSYYGTRTEGSFSLTSPQRHGIFLNREWTVLENGEPDRPIAGSRGVLIPSVGSIKHIRVFDREKLAERRKEGHPHDRHPLSATTTATADPAATTQGASARGTSPSQRRRFPECPRTPWRRRVASSQHKRDADHLGLAPAKPVCGDWRSREK
ncbi:MAG TPA: DUF6338 family protein [Candidatus Dormibacteraeota bacterium]|nr:DUF6338 family protein [Candidatus Dormibacteraeota bacterium]